MIVDLRRSNRKDKRYMATFDGKRTIHFGARDGKTFIDHKDDKKKSAWMARHAKRENWNRSGIHTAGFWSKHLLWNKPSLKDSIKNIEKTFNINIIYKYG